MQQQETQAPVRAAIDIGSNTIHVVVAQCMPADLDILADEVEMVRIGESVTKTGEISAEKRDAALKVLRDYGNLAQQHDAQEVLVVATEAIRKAKNSAEFVDAVRQQTGLDVHLVSGEVEATLTFYGATYEEAKKPNAAADLGVMDLGGGSMELVTAHKMHISSRASLPVGSGWLHDRYLPSDPPSADELTLAQTFLRTYFAGIHLEEQPPMLIVTGGSANSLLYLARQAFRLNEQEEHLTFDDLLHCEGLLTALPAEEIAQRYEQPVSRARILPAGALIIREMMARLTLHEIAVSPHGIREGALLARERFGEHWLEQVEREAHGQNGNAGVQFEGSVVGIDEATFAQTGRQLLQERVKKLFEWRDEVLKNDDVEAVHKMRVASRRLRATMDAFESCCEPKTFKKAYRKVQRMADILGQARDTDVMLQGLRTQLEQAASEEQAGVRWLIERLSDYRRQTQDELKTFFKALDEDALQGVIMSSIKKGAGRNGKG